MTVKYLLDKKEEYEQFNMRKQIKCIYTNQIILKKVTVHASNWYAWNSF